MVRLEEECAVIEALNSKRVLVKDAFRAYASSALTEITVWRKSPEHGRKSRE